jgi:hypothetical protein
VVVHVYNPSTQKVEAEDLELEASLDYTVSSSLSYIDPVSKNQGLGIYLSERALA